MSPCLRRERNGQGVGEYLLILIAALVVVSVAVYYITKPPLPLDKEILHRLKGGPKSLEELDGTFNKKRWSAFQHIEYNSAIDNLVRDNHIRVEGLYGYTMLYITPAGLAYLEGVR